MKATIDEISETIQNPDLINTECKSYIFFLKDFRNKGKLLVYALVSPTGEYFIQCADWMVDRPEEININ